MKLFYIAILFLIVSCSNNHSIKKTTEAIPTQENPLGLCDEEIELLKFDWSEKIENNFKYDYNHKLNSQFDYIQNQTELDLCDDLYKFSTSFLLSDVDTINTALWVERYCPNSKRDWVRWHPKVIEVLVNSKLQLLIDGAYMENNDSIIYDIENLINEKYFEINNDKGYVMFNIQWDSETPIENRIAIFEKTIKAYLLSTNKFSQENFNKKICELERFEIDSLRKKYHITW